MFDEMAKKQKSYNRVLKRRSRCKEKISVFQDHIDSATRETFCRFYFYLIFDRESSFSHQPHQLYDHFQEKQLTITFYEVTSV